MSERFYKKNCGVCNKLILIKLITSCSGKRTQTISDEGMLVKFKGMRWVCNKCLEEGDYNVVL